MSKKWKVLQIDALRRIHNNVHIIGYYKPLYNAADLGLDEIL